MELYNDDCINVLKNIPDNSVGMVLTDPPYGMVNWSSVYDWDDALPMDLIWPEIRRILKDDIRVTCLFANEPFATKQRMSNIEEFKYDLIWVKNMVSNPVQAKIRPLKIFEYISVFSKGKLSPGREGNVIYNPQGLIDCEKSCSNSEHGRINMVGSRFKNKNYTQTKTGYPKDILYYDCERGYHPTQKPVALLEYLIKTFSYEGETVLDMTMGSGSTGVACVNVNRNFIGIEKDEEYFSVAQDRIQKSNESLSKLFE